MHRFLRTIIAVCLLALAFTPARAAVDAMDASGFVRLSDAVPDAIQQLRYYTTYNFVGERIDGYDINEAALTREGALALRRVSDDVVALGYRLVIYDAYRPAGAVSHFVRWAQDTSDTRMKAFFYPELSKSALFEQGYIGSRSGHSRGSTVDVTLFDMAKGEVVDMGGAFDYFGILSHPGYTGITPEQYENRMLLRQVMTNNGFKPLSTEWWHFTLLDEPYPDTYFSFPLSAVEASDEFSGQALPETAYDQGTLSMGDRGEAVRQLQRRLLELGWLGGDVDGIFGSITRSAVQAFQRASGLDASGIAGAETRASLYSSDALRREAAPRLTPLPEAAEGQAWDFIDVPQE